MYVQRSAQKTIQKMLGLFPVVLITGPRQAGKTTLIQKVFGDAYTYVSLDDLRTLDMAKNEPKLFFLEHPGKLIIDEAQRAPELTLEIKRRVDAEKENGCYILIASHNFLLSTETSDSLAGRVAILELPSLSLREIVQDTEAGAFSPALESLLKPRPQLPPEQVWPTIFRGSMPVAYNAEEFDRELFYRNYVNTVIERDICSILNVRNTYYFQKFVQDLALHSGQLVNYNSLAKEVGVDNKTIKSWFGVMEQAGLIRLIQPYSNNRLKRIVKTPVLYFMDTGLLTYLTRWPTPETLAAGTMSGAVFETFVVSEIIKSYQNEGKDLLPIFFYRDKDGKEIDLVIQYGDILYPIEIKQTSRPRARMIQNASLLEKAEGFQVGTKTIISMVDKPTFLAEDTLAYPVTAL